MVAVLWPALVLLAVVAFLAFVRRNSRESEPETDLRSSLVGFRAIPAAPRQLRPVESGSHRRAASEIASRPRDLHLLPRQFVVLDLETTGLSPQTNEIIEIGAIRVDLDSDAHATFQRIVRPQAKIPHTIAALTGISQAMVDRDGCALPDALAEFIDFIQNLPLVTFNARFDMAFLYAAAGRYGVTIDNRYTCALELSRKAWPDLRSHRLADLAALGNLSDDDTHRAVGDCRRALMVFMAAAAAHGKPLEWNCLPSRTETGQAVGMR